MLLGIKIGNVNSDTERDELPFFCHKEFMENNFFVNWKKSTTYANAEDPDNLELDIVKDNHAD